MAKIFTSADQLIGHTPLLELAHLEEELSLGAKIYAKLEYFNPAGSVKDRIAKAMLDDAEKSGKLKKDSVIIEPTSVVNSEERLPGQAFFRVERLGDVNHLVNGGEPISSSGYFADVLSE